MKNNIKDNDQRSIREGERERERDYKNQRTISKIYKKKGIKYKIIQANNPELYKR